MYGYKVKPVVPSHVELSFNSVVDAVSDDRSKVDYSNASVFGEGIQVKSTINSDLIFETLDIVDFTISGSADRTSATLDEAGLITEYTLTRKVRAVSGESKTRTFTIDIPKKFRKITLPDTDVIDIISVKDTNGNEWYEVDFLAQDKVPLRTHYTQDVNRDSAYHNINGQIFVTDVPVPNRLEYIVTAKRFTRETNIDNSTSLVFGNGILKDGSIIDDGFLDLEQLGIIVPGQSEGLNDSIDPTMGDEYSTLGETPAHTNLTVSYRVGGGIGSNESAGNITDIVDGSVIKFKDGGSSLGPVTNLTPARGGKGQETIEEIRERTKAFFTTQNRCVTKEDYEARVLNMQSRFGGIAKVYVKRTELPQMTSFQDMYAELLGEHTDPIVTGITDNAIIPNDNNITTLTSIQDGLTTNLNGINLTLTEAELAVLIDNINDNIGYMTSVMNSMTAVSTNLGTTQTAIEGLGGINLSEIDTSLGTIELSILSYDQNKNLVGNFNADELGTTDSIPLILKTNIQNHLNNFKLLTDDVTIQDGFIINFGVFFDVIANLDANKQEVKLKCIQKMINYFRIERMQFSQPIYVSKLEYELMGIDGVRAVNYVTISQDINYNSEQENQETFFPVLFRYIYDSESGDLIDNDSNSIYGYNYDFEANQESGVILPPSPANPGVFELKNPNQNIQGVVR